MNNKSANPVKSRQLSSLASLSIVCGITFIVIRFFQWNLVEYLTPFFIAPLMLFLIVILGLFLIISIIYFLLNRKNPKRAVRPLLINLAAILIFLFFPFTEVWLEIEFRSRLQGYNEVVELVKSGQLQPNDIGLTQLPPGYWHLSRGGGDIVIDMDNGTLSVFFFTFRGVLDNYSGYMYREDDTPPESRVAPGCTSQVIKKRPHWYFCASR